MTRICCLVTRQAQIDFRRQDLDAFGASARRILQNFAAFSDPLAKNGIFMRPGLDGLSAFVRNLKPLA